MESNPLAGVDANLLVAVDALLVEQHVGRAARRVGLSASAMSHALSRIRAAVGDPVLVRSGKGMVPTARAAEIAPLLREAVRLFGRALVREAPHDPKLERRSFAISAVDFAQNHVLQRLATALRTEAPLVDLVIVPFGPGAFDELRAGKVELAIAASRGVKGFSHCALAEEPFVCVARKGNPALHGRMTVARFASLHHVMISPRGKVTGASDVTLKKKGLARRVALVVPTFLAAALAVAESDLVLTCARTSAEQTARWLGLQIFDPPMRVPPFSLGMFWHARAEYDRFGSFVRTRLVALAGR